MAEASFRVPTAFCPHCQHTIEQAVSRLRGVEQVEVDLADKKVTVGYDAEAIKSEEIGQRIEGCGFPVGR